MKLNQSPLLCLLLLLPFSIVIAKDSAPSLSVANTLQSNMVIQQGKPLHILGMTISGPEIIERANWN